ncbi:phosphatidylinositol kinase [Citricoccus sp. SGAir0253]|uniref:phosphatidylinositol kinase n=1 Tax=Citricoccus sp. SGAir0253 TaxID=2567881 RepID=UPI001AEF9F45|nr:phosphatidylinositol kinase [Citricoccus sp. SGAir0253]
MPAVPADLPDPTPPPGDDPAAVLGLLLHGDLELLGRMVNSSNETFLVELSRGPERHWGIYKPRLGERPLRDFPPGLHRRERAAYLLSEVLGWGVVPPTVIREDAPFGEGSVQLFVEHDPARHYFTLVGGAPEGVRWGAGVGVHVPVPESGPPGREAEDRHDDGADGADGTEGEAPGGVAAVRGIPAQLRRLALFDLVANNADRKAGHVLAGTDGRLWGIDHGLCFAAAFKLRTVMWDFAGEEIDAGWLAGLAPLADEVPGELADLLHWREADALRGRVRQLLSVPRFPLDTTGMRFPWPLV